MQRHPDADSLIDDVRAVGYKLQAAKPVGKAATEERKLESMYKRLTPIVSIKHTEQLQAREQE